MMNPISRPLDASATPAGTGTPPPTGGIASTTNPQDRFERSTESGPPLMPSAPEVTFKEVTLVGDEFGVFSGAKVKTPVDASNPLVKDVETQNRLKSDMKRLIAQGRILYTRPGQELEPDDYFDQSGRPYAGVVRWVDGQMWIEKVLIVS